MTLTVFPTLSSVDIETTQRPEFNSNIQTSLSGHMAVQSFRQYPLVTFTIPINAMIDSLDGQGILDVKGFYEARRGPGEAFLYDNSDTATRETFGTPNSALFDFQIAINTQPVNNLKAAPTVYVDGVAAIYHSSAIVTPTTANKYHYTVSTTGLVTIKYYGSDGTTTSAVATGKVLTWSGDYYYLVRFVEDGYDFKRLLYDTHEAELTMIGAIDNRVL